MTREWPGVFRSSVRSTLLTFIVLIAACVAPGQDEPEPGPEVVAVPEPEEQVVRVGLERLAQGQDEILRGRRIGLIVHAASVTVEGRHAIDIMQDLDLNVVLRRWSFEGDVNTKVLSSVKRT